MEKKDLKPAGVFHYFEEICQVPRPSKKEEKIIAYLKAFGEKHKLETKVDEAGNVLIKKPATPGMENRKTVVLQSHIDMVCEKNNDVKHDFLTDPIETEIDGEWLKAKGTTLGADNHRTGYPCRRQHRARSYRMPLHRGRGDRTDRCLRPERRLHERRHSVEPRFRR